MPLHSSELLFFVVLKFNLLTSTRWLGNHLGIGLGYMIATGYEARRCNLSNPVLGIFFLKLDTNPEPRSNSQRFGFWITLLGIQYMDVQYILLCLMRTFWQVALEHLVVTILLLARICKHTSCWASRLQFNMHKHEKSAHYIKISGCLLPYNQRAATWLTIFILLVRRDVCLVTVKNLTM